MPKSKAAPAGNGRSPLTGSAEITAIVARTAPFVLALLANGAARPRSAIIAALTGQHSKDDVVRTLMRLAVTEQLVETKSKYSLVPELRRAAEES
jgi:hypothetical protein